MKEPMFSLEESYPEEVRKYAEELKELLISPASNYYKICDYLKEKKEEGGRYMIERMYGWLSFRYGIGVDRIVTKCAGSWEKYRYYYDALDYRKLSDLK